MAITRSQQARQMLKTAGAVEQDGSLNFVNNSESVTVPKEFKARSNAPKVKLAYITDAEAKMLKKKKPGTPHKGPKGIPSYDTFGSIDASGKDTGVAGTTASAAETGGRTERDRADFRAAGLSPQDVQDLRSAAIASGAGQRVNPGFFDSRNVISPADLRAAKQFAPQAFRRTRGGGLLGFLTSGGILGNLVRGLGQRFGLGKKFNEPTYDMRQFSDIGLLTDRVNPNNLDIYNEFVDDEDNNQIPIVIDNDMSLVPDRGLLEVPGIPITPFQKDIKQDDFEEGLPQDVLENLIAFEPGSKKDKRLKSLFKQKGLAEDIDAPFPKKLNEELERLLKEDEEQTEFPKTELIRAADGGMIGGGIMDAAGRQQYFLGKLVKKATRAVKKIVKSPVGKLGLGAALAFTPFGKENLIPFIMKNKKLAAAAGLIGAPFIFGDQDDQQQSSGFTGSVGGQIDPKAYTDPYGVLFGAFKAEGGSMKDEPVAKRTMPLLDMGGQEMDLRAEGGFVPIGRMEKADDVPARLSKNEFVFTAEAVRNAGDGDVDKGAEVMYNMMKNLEAGGEVSKESQGLEGARNMFQTSKRLEEVL
jgi:hypothetical protein